MNDDKRWDDLKTGWDALKPPPDDPPTIICNRDVYEWLVRVFKLRAVFGEEE
jgi:hypothetical protein